MNFELIAVNSIGKTIDYFLGIVKHLQWKILAIFLRKVD